MKHFFLVLLAATLLASTLAISGTGSKSGTDQKPAIAAPKGSLSITTMGVPQFLSHQGYIADSVGNGVTGSLPMTFRMFDDSLGGSLAFTQTFPGVSLAKGIFTVNLDVSGVTFNNQYWLETEVNGQTLAPRTRLTSAPYSLAPWTTSGTDVYYDGGNVGIGTSTPTAKLEVSGGDAKINSLTIGHGSGSGTQNTAVGSNALTNNSSGDFNTAVGADALQANSIGWTNTANGAAALFHNTSGSNNTALGNQSLFSNTGGNGNTAVGYAAMTNSTGGTNNTAVGYQAGQYSTDGLINTTVIGANSRATASNSVVLGNDSARVGIGTTAPSAKLDVVGSVKIADGTQGAGKVLTSNATGLASWESPSATSDSARIAGTVADNAITSAKILDGTIQRSDAQPSFKAPYADTADFARSVALGADGFTDDGSIVRLTTGSDNVGIGTTTPTKKLDVVGSARVSDTLFASNVSSNSPLRLQTAGATRMYFDDVTGNIGVGTTTPSNSFQVEGTSMFNGATAVGTPVSDYSRSLTIGSVNGFPAANIFFDGHHAYDWQIDVYNGLNNFGDFTLSRVNQDYPFIIRGTSSNIIMNASSAGRVGIGTNTPAAKLDIAGNVKIADGTQGSGKILTSDANGVASWGTAPVPSQWTTNGSNVYYTSGNVGIGTPIPSAKLDVNGSLRFVSLLGQGSTAAGLNAIANGATSTAGGNYSTVGGGVSNDASNSFATIAGGRSNTSSGSTSTVGGGESNSASSTYATVGGGVSNTASAGYSTVPGGYHNSATGQYSFAAGANAKANHMGSFTWSDAQLGDFVSTGNNQFLIRAAGGVGIGTNSPGSALSVAGSADFTGGVWSSAIRTKNEAGTMSFYDVGFYVPPAVSTLPQLIVGGPGGFNAGIINTTPVSDRRLKEDINPMQDEALSRIMSLRPVSFQFKHIDGFAYEKMNPGTQEGFIADELQSVIPSAVKGDKNAVAEDGKIQPQTLNPLPVIAVLTKAIQEQQKQIDELKALVKSLAAQKNGAGNKSMGELK
ncbi:MAG TPA: tail fiber domain-containing protein [Bacteroidota bacterium]|nr:tail fiber domain-containing protein [Bacteroidota bacterium]